MIRNSLISSLTALAFIGVAACGQDQSEVPADEFPATEAPAVAPPIEPAEPMEPVEQDTDLDTTVVEENAVDAEEVEPTN